MRTPIQGLFTTSGMIIWFILGHFTVKIPALWIFLVPIGIIWIIAFCFSFEDAYLS
jgi:hypothetical protein